MELASRGRRPWARSVCFQDSAPSAGRKMRASPNAGVCVCVSLLSCSSKVLCIPAQLWWSNRRQPPLRCRSPLLTLRDLKPCVREEACVLSCAAPQYTRITLNQQNMLKKEPCTRQTLNSRLLIFRPGNFPLARFQLHPCRAMQRTTTAQ